MKLILNNANLEFRTTRPWKQYTLTWNNGNSQTGVVSSVETQGQYSRAGVGGEFISTDDDGKRVYIARTSTSEILVYVYDSAKTYLGYGQLGSAVPATTEFADIISAMPSFKIGTTEQDRDTVIASAKYYKVLFGSPITPDGQIFKVR